MSQNAALNLVASGEAAAGGVTIAPWQPAHGAVVSGYVYDGVEVPSAIQVKLRDALLRHGALLFEPGVVTAANFTKFVGIFGEVVLYAGPHSTTAPENSDANVVDSLRDDRLRNHVWHIDGTFRKSPPSYTALFGKTIPEEGGNTVFSHAVAAYESFDPLFRAYLDTLIVVNSGDATGHLGERYDDPEELARERAKLPPFEEHVIRVHPQTGRKQIYVNESYTVYIKGVSRIVSQNLLGILFDAVKDPQFQARHTWKPGQLLVWDNRVVQHRAIKDYGTARRVLYRASIR